MLPTLSAVLGLPVLAAGRPRVVAGAEHLGHEVRWAHVAEVADISELLRGNELILTTGVALPRTDDGIVAFVQGLAALPVAGLVVELGRAYAGRLPTAMVRAAERFGLPLVELTQPVAFIEVTEAVHSLIIDGQISSLRQAQSLHETFTELAVEGADTAEVVRQAARMAGAPVVLETPSHLVVEHDAAGTDEAALLARWQQRSRAVRVEGRAGVDPASGWVVATVGARGEDWGRLVLVRGMEDPRPHDLMLVERTATTLALQRLITRDREGLERQTHRTLLTALMEHQHPDAEIGLRARALGVTLDGRRLLGAVVRWREGRSATTLATQARLRDLADAVAQAARDASAPALVGAIDDRSVGLLLALDRRDGDGAVLDGLSRAIERVVRYRMPGEASDQLLLAAGTVVAGLRDARRSVVEAQQVADAAAHLPRVGGFVRLHDVGVRGLLSLLRDDPRVETFTERELGPLLDREDDLLEVLRAYLACGRNKSAAAASMHLSRPAFYDRLTRLATVLDEDLDDVETCLALHVALLARDTR
ncbi:PucR family transcriptional regulator [Angustibacter luteus]|uniref:PucR family transcriptional regulator n=1 Tax=Angustibacter luteus TaxID=658456 RepID=A0ABW1JJ25_9ACTN